MGRNLPDHVSISDSDAPWNQDHPEPSDISCSCPNPACGWRGTVDETDYSGTSSIPCCPECGTEVDRV